MDQTRTPFGSSLNEVITDRQKVARRRWAILAKALKSPVEEPPLRRISSFMLLRTQQLAPPKPDQKPKRTWYEYSLHVDGAEFAVRIGHRSRTFSAEDLMGFNNTGNVCVWPSEETLGYYVCANLALFDDKRVLELGGGMSCLAGLLVAKFAAAAAVTVTDGNRTSVENVEAALRCNEFACPVECKVLKWGPLDEQFDVVLCADCLFFDDARADLIECLWTCVGTGGVALLMAPRRGDTLARFVAAAERRGFACNVVQNYHPVVWQKRLQLLGKGDYVDDIHYPILIEVTKYK